MLNLLTVDEILTYGADIALPNTWVNILVAYRDLININAAIQDKCSIGTFFNRFTELFSLQGVS